MSPPRRRDDWAEDCEWLASWGVPPLEWPARLGTTVAGLARSLRRAGRPDLARPVSAEESRTRRSLPSGRHCDWCGLPLTMGQRQFCSVRHAALHRERQRREVV